MQTNNNGTGGLERLCIETTKVYDWVLNEEMYELDFSAGLQGEGASCNQIDVESPDVTCEVTDLGTEEVSRETEDFLIGDQLVPLQIVTLRKNFEVTLRIPRTNPNPGQGAFEELSQEFSRCEQVVLCAPFEGPGDPTDIVVEYVDTDCFVCQITCDQGPPTVNAVINVRICQSIKSTFDVTLEVVGQFCEPRDIIDLPDVTCQAPPVPPQCPAVFPNGNNGNNG